MQNRQFQSLSVAKALFVSIYLVLLVWAAVELYPILFMFFTALKTDAEIMKNVWSLPKRLHFQNFIQAWQGGYLEVPISRYFLNSVIIVCGTLLSLTLTGTFAAYALARYKFPGMGFLRNSLLFALAVPVHATLIPVFHFLGRLGLRNTYQGLIAVYTAFWLPFTILMMYAYFKSFPRELEEAARIEGCSDFGVFWRIVMPMSRGAVASISIVNFVGIWSELLFAFVIMNKEMMKTITVGVLSFRGQYYVQWGFMFAGLSIASIPTLLFFLIFQRQITKGMTVGAFH